MSREMIEMPMQQPTPASEREATPESVRIIQEISKEILQTLPRELVERGVPLAKANEETAGFDQQIKNLDPTIIIKLYERNGGLQGTIRALFNKAIPQIVARASVKETSEEPAVTSATEKEPEMMIETIPLWNTEGTEPEHLGESTASETKFVKEVIKRTKMELLDYLINKFRPIHNGREVTDFLNKQFEGAEEEAHAMIKKWETFTTLNIDVNQPETSLNIILNKIITEMKKSDQMKQLEEIIMRYKQSKEVGDK